jgi:hypothetical protein
LLASSRVKLDKGLPIAVLEFDDELVLLISRCPGLNCISSHRRLFEPEYSSFPSRNS